MHDSERRLPQRKPMMQAPMMNGDKAPSFDQMVRERAAVTLGEAKQYAAALPADKRRAACGCYTCYTPACPGCCVVTCLVNFCGGCLMYNPFMCACPDSSTPGAWTCTDMKGVSYFLVPVDEKGSLAFFSGFEVNDSQNVGCYCSKLC